MINIDKISWPIPVDRPAWGVTFYLFVVVVVVVVDIFIGT